MSPENKTLIMKNENDTKAFGLGLAEKLKPGSVVALIGDLGTGKTALTGYIAQGLGSREMITSPTFTIVREHRDGRIPLFHFDVYRVNDEEDMFEIGYEEYFYGDGVCVVEWADLIEDLLPENAIVIKIKYGKNENERIYDVRGI
ncbi:MAG: tRNA (adenosine(37)-N6)-threonylcarbamoyltransferase complex ATPase subunit type 1 TsaE [Clostridia bacterium]|nr:tRNA (adenosine(37)-N6)-threonylcarbamoyltransferase complex ATPase subunit type 1 TsaE [Clostridia bacterium]